MFVFLWGIGTKKIYQALICWYQQTGPAQFGQNHLPCSFSPHQAIIATIKPESNFFSANALLKYWHARAHLGVASLVISDMSIMKMRGEEKIVNEQTCWVRRHRGEEDSLSYNFPFDLSSFLRFNTFLHKSSFSSKKCSKGLYLFPFPGP